MRPLHAVVVGAIPLLLVVAGCGGAIPSSNGGPATLKLTSSQDGRYLVDSQGHSLYLFEKDDGARATATVRVPRSGPPSRRNRSRMPGRGSTPPRSA